jgi:hypothetical protein
MVAVPNPHPISNQYPNLTGWQLQLPPCIFSQMGFKEFRKGSHKSDEYFGDQHRFEHWYVDNQVYFITARVRHQFPAFQADVAKAIFWDRFDHAVAQTSYTPWVTSLLDNHYHTLGYLKTGDDLLPTRIKPFWTDAGHQNYFDGCIRDELQARRAFRYTLLQCRRHGICHDWRDYPHTRLATFSLDRVIERCHELEAFMEEVPYKRYEIHRKRGGRTRWDE